MEDLIDQRVAELRKLSPEQFALKLKAFRKQYGYTQETLARRVRVRRDNILRWENSKVRVSASMLRILVREGVL